MATTTQLGATNLEVHDPRLSDDANAELTRAVAAVLADDAAHGGPADDEWQHSRGTPRRHWRMTAEAVDARIVLVPVAVMFAVIGLIVATHSSASLVVIPLAGMAIGVSFIADFIFRMAREHEHVAPETAAMLTEEGIADPDRLFADLLSERRHAH